MLMRFVLLGNSQTHEVLPHGKLKSQSCFYKRTKLMRFRVALQ